MRSIEKYGNRFRSSLGILVFLVMLLLVVFVWHQNRDPMRNMEEIPVASYLDSPRNFIGNSYSLTAQIDDLIHGDLKIGRIFSVIPQNYSIRIPVFIPSSLSENLYARQRFKMKATVKEDGLLWIDHLYKY